MRFNDKKQKIDYLIQLIEKEETGSVLALSNRLCVCKRTLFRYMDELRESGYLIGYCKIRKSYYFIKPDSD